MYSRFSKAKIESLYEAYRYYNRAMYLKEMLVTNETIIFCFSSDAFDSYNLVLYCYAEDKTEDPFYYALYDPVEVDYFLRYLTTANEDFFINKNQLKTGNQEITEKILKTVDEKALEYIKEDLPSSLPDKVIATLPVKKAFETIRPVLKTREAWAYKHDVYAKYFILELSHNSVNFIATDEVIYIVYSNRCNLVTDEERAILIPKPIAKLKFKKAFLLENEQYYAITNNSIYVCFPKIKDFQYHKFEELTNEQTFVPVIFERSDLSYALKKFPRKAQDLLCVKVGNNEITLTKEGKPLTIAYTMPCKCDLPPFKFYIPRFYLDYLVKHAPKLIKLEVNSENPQKNKMKFEAQYFKMVFMPIYAETK